MVTAIVYLYGNVAFPHAALYEEHVYGFKIVTQFCTAFSGFNVIGSGIVLESLCNLQLRRSSSVSRRKSSANKPTQVMVRKASILDPRQNTEFPSTIEHNRSRRNTAIVISTSGLRSSSASGPQNHN